MIVECAGRAKRRRRLGYWIDSTRSGSKAVSRGARHRTPKMRTFLVSLLKFYKAVISPWLPPACRFVPTCSEYACEAIEKYGVLRGCRMMIWRLLRCQPFCAGGYDPLK